jgi:glycosyltransferase involved in cell wall biosynthesis
MKCSIIVPTRNRKKLLELTLDSICNQKFKGEFEVIIVDDGSNDGTEEIVKKAKYDKLLISYFAIDHHCSSGPAKARNYGIRLAKGEVLCFVDSGMILKSNFIQRHCNAHTNGKNVVIGTVLGFNVLTDNKMFLDRFNKMELQSFIHSIEEQDIYKDPRDESYRNFDYKISAMPAPWHFFWTCNVSVDSQCIKDDIFFDEKFSGWGLEDIDFGYRLYKKGYIYSVDREAIAIHYPHDSIYDKNKKIRQENKNFKIFLDKYTDVVVEMYFFGRDKFFNEILSSFLKGQKIRLKKEEYPIFLKNFLVNLPPKIVIGGGNCTRILGERDMIYEYDEEIFRKIKGKNNIKQGLGISIDNKKHYDIAFIMDFWPFLSDKLMDRLLHSMVTVSDTCYILIGIYNMTRKIFSVEENRIEKVRAYAKQKKYSCFDLEISNGKSNVLFCVVKKTTDKSQN